MSDPIELYDHHSYDDLRSNVECASRLCSADPGDGMLSLVPAVDHALIRFGGWVGFFTPQT